MDYLFLDMMRKLCDRTNTSLHIPLPIYGLHYRTISYLLTDLLEGTQYTTVLVW